jgi:hypothetical protein
VVWPHGGVVHAEITADRADDDLPRVQADANLHLHSVRAPRLVRVAPQRLPHPQSRIARTHSVILVRHRGAEQRHNPVTHDLVHRALVAMHRFHHAL